MTNDLLVPSEGGLIGDVGGKPLLLSNEELCVVGCRNCVWKEGGNCPEGLVGSEEREEGYCDELASFVVGLADPGDIASSVWEKFHIYKARLVEASDYQDYLRLKKKLEAAKLDRSLSEDELRSIEMDLASAKLWWARLNESITKNLCKVSDRHVKSRVADKPSTGIGMAKTVNFNIIQDKEGTPVKEIVDKSKD